jgi:hypothetical protein
MPVCGLTSQDTAAADGDGVTVGAIVAVGATGDAVALAEGAVDAAADGEADGTVGPHAATDSAASAITTMGRWRVAVVTRSSGKWGKSGRMKR